MPLCIVPGLYTARSPEYRSYRKMLGRCYNPKSHAFHRYGGRGIIVCECWRKSFVTFYQNMGPRPTIKHTLERINNNGNYEPRNCRWATRKEQMQNTCKARIVAWKGRLLSIQGWGKELGITANAMAWRLKHYPLDMAMTLRRLSGEKVKQIAYATGRLTQVKGASGYRGAFRTEHGRYKAMIRYNRECYHLGTYATPQEANAAYNRKLSELLGDDPKDPLGPVTPKYLDARIVGTAAQPKMPMPF